MSARFAQGGSMWWLWLGLMGCAHAGGDGGQALGVPEGATAQERQAVQQLAVALEGRAGEAARYTSASALAAALAQGTADADVRTAAVALLVELRDEAPSQLVVAPHVAEPLPECIVAVAPPVEPLNTGAPTVLVAEEQLQAARAALRAGDPHGAIDALTPLRGTIAWADAAGLWAEAVDGWVAEERERAGTLFLQARDASGAARRQGLLNVRDLLAELLADYPDSAYTEALTRNLERVEQALEPAD